MKRSIALAVVLILSGCDNRIEVATTAVEKELIHKNTVEYRQMKTFPGDVVCGEVNASGAWGEGAGYRRFIVRGDTANTLPSDDDWVIFCSKDSAAALQSRLGIGPLDKTNPDLLTVQQHLNELNQALQRYFTDRLVFPATEPGLQSLVSSHSTSATPNAKSYIDSVADDPWGRPYHYEKPRQLHGSTKKTYRLFTLGRDGIKGGRGENADIGNLNLKYLNHISNL